MDIVMQFLPVRKYRTAVSTTAPEFQVAPKTINLHIPSHLIWMHHMTAGSADAWRIEFSRAPSPQQQPPFFFLVTLVVAFFPAFLSAAEVAAAVAAAGCAVPSAV